MEGLEEGGREGGRKRRRRRCIEKEEGDEEARKCFRKRNGYEEASTYAGCNEEKHKTTRITTTWKDRPNTTSKK